MAWNQTLMCRTLERMRRQLNIDSPVMMPYETRHDDG
jgi:hypothetical protein